MGSFLFLRFSLPSTHIFVFALTFGYEYYLANTSKKSSFSIIPMHIKVLSLDWH